MLRALLEFLLRLHRALRKWLFSNSRLSKYFADLRNSSGFQDQGAHEVMLADRVRIETYREALDRTVAPGDVVMDLGAGTGILSFFAAQKARQVYAVEHSAVIETAQQIAAANHIENVRFFRMNSRDFQPPEKVDVVVHEQIGGGNLFSENMLENLVDARRRLLRPGGKIVPNQFQVFLEPVALKPSSRIPLLWEFDLHSIRYASLRPEREALPMAGKPVLPQHRRPIFPDDVEACLCAPRPILSFDLETLEMAGLPRRIHYENVAVQAGRIDGLCMYFKTFTQGRAFIQNGPGAPATHWWMTLYRGEETQVEAGAVIAYEIEFGAFDQAATWSIQWLKPERK